MKITKSSDNRVILESETHRAVVSKDWLGKPVNNWLLSAYEKKGGVSGGSIDIGPEPKGKQNGTAPLQNASPSKDKGNNNINSNQTNNKNFDLRVEKQYFGTPIGETDGMSFEQRKEYVKNRFKLLQKISG